MDIDTSSHIMTNKSMGSAPSPLDSYNFGFSSKSTTKTKIINDNNNNNNNDENGPKSLVKKERAMELLIEEIMEYKNKPSSLYDDTLPPHLANFKRQLDKSDEKKSSALPQMSQLSPRSIKRLLALPPPNQTDLEKVDKIHEDVKKVNSNSIYEKLIRSVDKTQANKHYGKTKPDVANPPKYEAPIIKDEDLIMNEKSSDFYRNIELYQRRKIAQDLAINGPIVSLNRVKTPKTPPNKKIKTNLSPLPQSLVAAGLKNFLDDKETNEKTIIKGKEFDLSPLKYKGINKTNQISSENIVNTVDTFDLLSNNSNSSNNSEDIMRSMSSDSSKKTPKRSMLTTKSVSSLIFSPKLSKQNNNNFSKTMTGPPPLQISEMQSYIDSVTAKNNSIKTPSKNLDNSCSKRGYSHLLDNDNDSLNSSSFKPSSFITKHNRNPSTYTETALEDVQDIIRQYAPTINETELVGQQAQQNYQEQQVQYQESVNQMDSIKRDGNKIFDNLKVVLYQENGLDVDTEFTKRRLFGQKTKLLQYYVYSWRTKCAWMWLRIQVRKVTESRIVKAGLVLTRVARGMLGRMVVRQKKINISARQLSEQKAAKALETMLKWEETRRKLFILKAVRRTLAKIKERKLLACCKIQRVMRGILPRKLVRGLLKISRERRRKVVIIQCSYRSRLARRTVAVLRKINLVKDWIIDVDSIEKSKLIVYARDGAAMVIQRYYRRYVLMKKLRTVLFWRHQELAIFVQRRYRGFIQYKKYNLLIRQIREFNNISKFAAIKIQRLYRGDVSRRKTAIKIAENKEAYRLKMIKKRKRLRNWLFIHPKFIARFIWRKFDPIRHIIVWKYSIKIQKVFRGYHARRRVWKIKIFAAIAKMVKYDKTRYDAAVYIQKISKGYVLRRENIRKKRIQILISIQCFIRCWQAKKKVKLTRNTFEAYKVLRKSVRKYKAYKEYNRKRIENAAVGKWVIIIQRIVRYYLGKIFQWRKKSEVRRNKEEFFVVDSKLNKVLFLTQLQLIVESINTPLGRIPKSNVCGVLCHCLGPIQCLFVAATGNKDRTSQDELTTNKLDNKMLKRLLKKFEGLLKSKPVPKSLKSNSTKSNTIRESGLLLINAVQTNVLKTLKGKKALGDIDIDILFDKALVEAKQEDKKLSYEAFTYILRDIGYRYYNGPIKSVKKTDNNNDDNEKGESKSESFIPSSPEFRPKTPGTPQSPEILKIESTNSPGSVKSPEIFKLESPGSPASINSRPGSPESRPNTPYNDENGDEDDDEDNNNITKEPIFVNTVRNRLCWKESSLVERTLPDTQLILVTKLLVFCQTETWMGPIKEYLEMESRARVGFYVIRMQNLYRERKNRFWRALMRDRKAKALIIASHDRLSTLLQKRVRMFLSTRRMAHLAQKILYKYVPYVGAPYWYNPSTRYTSTKKPKILLHFEAHAISLPPEGLAFVVKCSSCSEIAKINCQECEDSMCKRCYKSLHCKGRRKFHHKYPIPMCSNCKYQVATKSCLSCIMLPPKLGSIQENMTQTERGTLCDACFSNIHDEIEKKLETEPEKKSNERLMISKTREAYLVGQDIRQKIITKHNYDNLVQPCEECNTRSASWRCEECDQIYCHKCLVGLHSLGGPFVKHKADSLPYYTCDMHNSYMTDKLQKKMQKKTEIMTINAQKARELFYKNSIVRVQAWWRQIIFSRRGLLYMKARRKVKRRFYRARLEDDKIRNKYLYRLKDTFGLAPILPTDTREQVVLKSLPKWMRQSAREYCWKNKEDFGFYLDMGGGGKKGVPRKGFDIGTVEELLDQAKHGGYRLPGLIILKRGETKHDTLTDLSVVVKIGQLVRIHHCLYSILFVSENQITLDRKWRFEDSEGEKIFRLPCFANENNIKIFRYKYRLYDWTLGGFFCRNFFNVVVAINSLFSDLGKSMENSSVIDGQEEDVDMWKQLQVTCESRISWAELYLQETTAELADMSEVHATGETALVDLRTEEEIHVDEVREAGGIIRKDGERFFATKAELDERKAREANMTETEIIATADEWTEEVNPVSGDIFFLHTATLECSSDPPASVALKRLRESEAAKNKEQYDAQQEMMKSMLSAKNSKKKGKR
jgi:hypothetical protein